MVVARVPLKHGNPPRLEDMAGLRRRAEFKFGGGNSQTLRKIGDDPEPLTDYQNVSLKGCCG